MHDVAYFVNMAKELEAMGCDSIGVKDMAGLLTPTMAGELVKALKAAVSLPLIPLPVKYSDFARNTTGRGTMSGMKMEPGK